MLIRPEVLQKWGVGGMQVHGIRGRRLVQKEVVETISNYNKSYFWWYWNLTCGHSTGSTRLKKIGLVYLQDLFEGKGKIGQCDLVCIEHFWMIGLMVVMLMSYSHVVSVVFVLSGVGPVLRSRYEIEWQKLCCIVSGEMSAGWHSRN